MEIPEEFMNLQIRYAQWATWCIILNKGRTEDGVKIENLRQLNRYSMSMAAEKPAPVSSEESLYSTVHLVMSSLPSILSGFKDPREELLHADLTDREVRRKYLIKNVQNLYFLTEDEAVLLLGELLDSHIDDQQITEELQAHVTSAMETDEGEILEAKIQILNMGITFLSLLYRSDLFYLGAELLEPFYDQLSVLSPEKQIIMAFYLSTFARENKNILKALEYLRAVQPIINSASLPRQAEHFFAYGNTLKDLNQYAAAKEAYLKAEVAFKQLGMRPPGELYTALGRLHMERGESLQAQEYLNIASEFGFSNDTYALLQLVAKIQTGMTQGEYVDLSDDLNRLMEEWKSASSGYADYAVLDLLADLSTANLNGSEEWFSYLAVCAAHLTDQRREASIIFSKIAKSTASLGRGAESRFWFEKSLRSIKDFKIHVFESGLFLNLAYSLFLLNQLPEAIHYFEKSIQSAQKNSDKPAEYRAISQLSMASALENPALSKDLSQLLMDQRFVNEFDSNYGQLGGHFLARELLTENPDAISKWGDFLRTSTSRDPITFPALQHMLDLREKNAKASGLDLPRNIMYGQFCTYLFERGYLSFVRRYFGIPSAMLVDWVLSKCTDLVFKKRIAAEWVINKTGLHLESRRGYESAKKSHYGMLRTLRAVIARLSLEQDLEARPNLDIYGNGLPRAESSASSFFDLASKNPEWIKMALEPEPEDFGQRNSAGVDYSSIFNKLLKGQQITADDFGASVDNFLQTELFEPLRTKYSDSNISPVIVELFQSKEQAHWICLDLAKGFDLSSLAIYSVDVSRTKAIELADQVRAALEIQGQGDFPFEEQLLKIGASFTLLFEPILDCFTTGTQLQLNLHSPWNSIPLEQVPTTVYGHALVDLYGVTRRDRFGHWLRHVNKSDKIQTDQMRFFGDPLGDENSALSLPYARSEVLAIASSFGATAYIGNECTVANLKTGLEYAQWLHIASHGHLFDQLGDIAALLLADSYMIGQELAALDLSRIQFAVLSACTSGLGATFGTSEMENLAEYMIEGGAASVLASQYIVSDEQTMELMTGLYSALRRGSSLTEGMREAFGLEVKRKFGMLILPWVLIGADQRIEFGMLQ